MIYDTGEPRINMVTHIRLGGVAKDARGGTLPNDDRTMLHK